MIAVDDRNWPAFHPVAVRLLQVAAAVGSRNTGTAARAQVLQQRTTRVHLRWADRALFISGLDMLGGGDRTAWLRDAVGTPTRLDQQIPCEQRRLQGLLQF